MTQCTVKAANLIMLKCFLNWLWISLKKSLVLQHWRREVSYWEECLWKMTLSCLLVATSDTWSCSCTNFFLHLYKILSLLVLGGIIIFVMSQKIIQRSIMSKSISNPHEAWVLKIINAKQKSSSYDIITSPTVDTLSKLWTEKQARGS